MDRRIIPLIMCGGRNAVVGLAQVVETFLPCSGWLDISGYAHAVSDATLFERPIVITGRRIASW